jgi:hypothetical protein
MMTRLTIAAAAATLVVTGACQTRHATADDCAALLDRVVALDMKESGYRDPALVAGRQAALRARFAPELGTCTGMTMPRGAMDCVAHVESVEDIAARCLR